MLSMQLEERLQERMQAIINKKHHELALYIEKMNGLSPLKKLNSGYSYVEDEDGKNIRSVSQTKVGQAITIRVKDGSIGASVTEISEK